MGRISATASINNQRGNRKSAELMNAGCSQTVRGVTLFRSMLHNVRLVRQPLTDAECAIHFQTTTERPVMLLVTGKKTEVVPRIT